MENYQPNSHKFREGQNNESEHTKKKVEKIVIGKVATKKKNEIQKLANVFISEDVANVKDYIFMDVLIPAIKKAISDVVTNGVDMILYGESGRNKKSSPASKVSYRSYYERERDRNRNTSTRSSGYDYDDIILDNRGEAEDVLSRMVEMLDEYGLVSVADLYDMVGVSGNYTDCKYGWTDLSSASVVRDRDGYLIKLPRAIPLN